MNINNKGEFFGTIDTVIANYISDDKIFKFRGLKKAPNSSRVRCKPI